MDGGGPRLLFTLDGPVLFSNFGKNFFFFEFFTGKPPVPFTGDYWGRSGAQWQAAWKPSGGD